MCLVWMSALTCTPFLFEGFPNEPAAEIALKTARSWVRRNQEKVSGVGSLSRSFTLAQHHFREPGGGGGSIPPINVFDVKDGIFITPSIPSGTFCS